MNDDPIPGGPGDMDEEALKRFLKETFGGALPEEALDGLDLSALAEQANLPQDPAQLRAAAAQMQHLFAAQGDNPVNWTMAEDIARRTAERSEERRVGKKDSGGHEKRREQRRASVNRMR